MGSLGLVFILVFIFKYLALLIIGICILARGLLKHRDPTDVTGNKRRRKLILVGVGLIGVGLLFDVHAHFRSQNNISHNYQLNYEDIAASGIQLYLPRDQQVGRVGSKQALDLTTLNMTGATPSKTYITFHLTSPNTWYLETNVGTNQLTSCPDAFGSSLSEVPCSLTTTEANGTRIYAVVPSDIHMQGDAYFIQAGGTLISPSSGYFQGESGPTTISAADFANSLVAIPLSMLNPAH